MKKDAEVIYGEPLLTNVDDDRCYDSLYEEYLYGN